MPTSFSGEVPDGDDGIGGVQHYWTVSHQSLVLSGPRAGLVDLATQIGAPLDGIVDLSPLRSVLALWGDTLLAYTSRFGADHDTH